MAGKVKRKIVLFDIDDTLIRHVGRKTSWEARYIQAMSDVYGMRPSFQDPSRHNGSIERKIAWDELGPMGLDRGLFLRKFPLYISRRLELYEADMRIEPLYEKISDACEFAMRISRHTDAYIPAVLTGNAKAVARWKLNHTEVPDIFLFGLYGDEADDRTQLAGRVFHKVKREFGLTIDGKDVIIIGDTVHDVRCGKSISAVTIAVASGSHTQDMLRGEHPDVLAGSLLDKQVSELLGLV